MSYTPPQGTLITGQSVTDHIDASKDSFSPHSNKPKSDILSDLQPDPEGWMLIDSSALLCACRHHFDHLMSLLAKLPKDKALPFYQNAAQIFGAFSKSCQQQANEIEQQ